MRQAVSLVMALGIVISSIATAGAAQAARTGKQVYESVCIACHGTGAAGTPKFGDKVWVQLEKNWSRTPSRASGLAPKSGCTECTAEEIRAAVQYYDRRGKEAAAARSRSDTAEHQDKSPSPQTPFNDSMCAPCFGVSTPSAAVSMFMSRARAD